jgi:hypothetical protein
MRENRPSGSEGGEAETNRPSLPLSKGQSGNELASSSVAKGHRTLPGEPPVGRLPRAASGWSEAAEQPRRARDQSH